MTAAIIGNKKLGNTRLEKIEFVTGSEWRGEGDSNPRVT